MSDPCPKCSSSPSLSPSRLPSVHAATSPAGRVRRRYGAALLALALLAPAPACRDGGGGARDEKSSGVRRYTVRGEVVRLPEASSTGARQVGLRHEAIDDFVNQAGKTVGMGSMVMSFDAAPGVSLEDVRVGDKVEIQLAVGWSPPALRIEQLRKLPADTALEFREARPKPTP
jgi:Cu/Ag efflux protein CusF